MKIPHGYVETSPGVFAKPDAGAKRLPGDQSQSAVRKALDSNVQGTSASTASITVCLATFTCRPKDPDNCIAGHKPLIDALRYSGLIPNDRPEDIKLESEQKKVRHRDEEKTVVKIIYELSTDY